MTAAEFAAKYRLKADGTFVTADGYKDAQLALMMEGFNESGCGWRKGELLVTISADGTICFPE